MGKTDSQKLLEMKKLNYHSNLEVPIEEPNSSEHSEEQEKV